jgi:hypothetical protein
MPEYLQAGREVTVAPSMAGANRGDFVLDRMADGGPHPLTTLELTNRFGRWRRVRLEEQRRGHYETKTGQVWAWERV